MERLVEVEKIKAKLEDDVERARLEEEEKSIQAQTDQVSNHPHSLKQHLSAHACGRSPLAAERPRCPSCRS
jgi:hypothetical protein